MNLHLHRRAVMWSTCGLALWLVETSSHQAPVRLAGQELPRQHAPLNVTGIFVVDGNSHTQSRHGAVAMPQNLLRELGNPPNLCLIDVAHSGHGMVEMRMRANAVDSLYQVGQVNLLLYWEGVHDLYEGFNAQETFERLRQYGIARQQAGFTVITLSLLPAREKTTPPTYERDRKVVNQQLRKHWKEFCDVFVDVAADPDLGNPDAPLKGVYYSAKDQVHMTDAGSQRVAVLVARMMLPVLSQ